MEKDIAKTIQKNRQEASQYTYVHHFTVKVMPKKYRTFPSSWSAKILDIEDGYIAIKFETGLPLKIDIETTPILTEADIDILHKLAQEQTKQNYDKDDFSVSFTILTKKPKIDEFKFGNTITSAVKQTTTEIRRARKKQPLD